MSSSRHLFEAIGTEWQIDMDTEFLEGELDLIAQVIESFDKEFSRFRSDSLVTRLALKGGDASFSEGVPEIFNLYDSLYEVTSGKVTPLIGDTLSALGYDATYSLQPQIPKPTREYAKVLRHTGQKIRVTKPTLIDIGAAGKGYLIDRLSQILARNHKIFTVNGSGDLYSSGEVRTIGLEHPGDASLVIGQVELTDAALCASAINRRAWGSGLHHIIDPSTNQPTKGIRATWVITDSAMIADGLATALFFSEPQILATKFNFSYVIMYEDGALRFSHDPRITIYE